MYNGNLSSAAAVVSNMVHKPKPSRVTAEGGGDKGMGQLGGPVAGHMVHSATSVLRLKKRGRDQSEKGRDLLNHFRIRC